MSYSDQIINTEKREKYMITRIVWPNVNTLETRIVLKEKYHPGKLAKEIVSRNKIYTLLLDGDDDPYSNTYLAHLEVKQPTIEELVEFQQTKDPTKLYEGNILISNHKNETTIKFWLFETGTNFTAKSIGQFRKFFSPLLDTLKNYGVNEPNMYMQFSEEAGIITEQKNAGTLCTPEEEIKLFTDFELYELAQEAKNESDERRKN
ncbi:MAG: hypothetical protein ABIC91_03120 [Nanoarchaeota archaeon]|nr:hypothetical protein [Nanoarchaeota archaeon]MBU1030084.1 hypothetical protein [Nanoarchaeota archaeon]MBU1849954.1 hypothetical protein [Nanoarchaeota archaeon]